jgi:hypothetical protein
MARHLVALILSAAALMAQNRVAPGNMYHRIYAVVPLVGTGTPNDPKRPMFAPSPSAAPSADRSGILAYQMQVSDDGKFALVEFVGQTPAALRSVLNATVPGVTLFEGGTASPAAIEAEFQKYKKSFKLSSLSPLRVP